MVHEKSLDSWVWGRRGPGAWTPGSEGVRGWEPGLLGLGEEGLGAQIPKSCGRSRYPKKQDTEV